MSLFAIPSEVVSLIASFLDDESLFHTRLVCKTINESVIALFGKRFFRKKGFLITTPSLEALHSIATHQHFGKYVQHVWFNPDMFPNSDFDDLWIATPFDSDLEEGDEDRLEMYRDHWGSWMSDHDDLIGSEHLERRLRLVFSQLPNLQVIGMRRGEEYWAYGSGLVTETVGYDPRALGSSIPEARTTLSEPTKLFMAIIKAVAGANSDLKRSDSSTVSKRDSVHLKRLYTDAIEVDHILPECLPEQTIQDALRHLLYIEINPVKAHLRDIPDVPSYRPLKGKDGRSQYGSNLVRIFRAAPQLREIGFQVFPDLRRAFDDGEDDHDVYNGNISHVAQALRDASMRSSYSYLAFDRLVHAVPLSNLSRIKLESMTTTAATLEAFLTPSIDKLESLKLRTIRLLPPSSSSSKDHTSNKPWQGIFSLLATSATRLSYLLLHKLQHEKGEISFVETPATGREPLPGDRSLWSGDEHLEDLYWASDAEDDRDENGYYFMTPSLTTPAIVRSSADRGGMWYYNSFTAYENLTIEAKGRGDVNGTLERLQDQHWCHRGLLRTYAMDDEVWYTDTSDEEW